MRSVRSSQMAIMSWPYIFGIVLGVTIVDKQRLLWFCSTTSSFFLPICINFCMNSIESDYSSIHPAPQSFCTICILYVFSKLDSFFLFHTATIKYVFNLVLFQINCWPYFPIITTNKCANVRCSCHFQHCWFSTTNFPIGDS